MPTKKISIYDSNNNYINDIAGPFNEDSALNLTCESEGGSLRHHCLFACAALVMSLICH